MLTSFAKFVNFYPVFYSISKKRFKIMHKWISILSYSNATWAKNFEKKPVAKIRKCLAKLGYDNDFYLTILRVNYFGSQKDKDQ